MPVFFASAEDEYKKHKELKREDIKAIMEWVKKQQHLPKLTEYQVIIFIFSCYFRLEAAKVCIENYFTVKTHCPEIFGNRNLKLIKEISDALLITVLPKKTPEGYYILFAKLLDTNPDKCDFNTMDTFVTMVASLAIAQLGTSDGQIVVIDCEGFSLGHMMKINLAMTKKLLFYLQEAMPVRLKNIHAINPHPVVDKAFALLKPFLGKALIQMVNIHPKIETFYKKVPKDLLPKEYGGNAGSVSELKEETIQNILDNEAYFREEETQLVDEKKRVGRSKFLDQINVSGVEGSFKKLDID